MPAATIPGTYVLGGTMRRTTITALLAAAVLALAGCSSSGDGDNKPTPAPTVTVTKTPALSAAEQKEACVNAWAKVLHDNADADQITDEPAECSGVSGDHYGMYAEGMMQRNRENIDAAQECIEDPACTELPVP